MKRRIISIISVLAVICSLIQVPVLAAKTSVDETKLTVLKNLDILGDGLPTKVTYNTFVNALMGYVLEGEARALYTPETFVKSSGMIEEDEEYKGSSAISFDDAIKYSVILLGYTSDLIPDINYKKIAGSENLLKGVAINDTLKPADMVALLYNLLDAEPLTVDSMSDKGAIYTSSADNTLLSMYRNIYVCNGIVTANEYTSIYSDRGAGEDRITIGNYTFEIGYEYDRELLGCNVSAYIKDDGENDPWVKYLYEQTNRNKKITILEEDILPVNLRSKIVEYEDERGRIEKVKLADHPKVIINGVFFGGYTAADLKPENGYVEFIDNNGDNKYEILNVKSYQTYVVESVNIDKKEIANKLLFSTTPVDPLKLENVEYTVTKAGEKIELSDIKVGDVLSVAMCRRTSDRICEIIVSSERSTFTVRGIKIAERTIYNGSNSFVISPEFFRALNYREIKVGDFCEFYLDAFGRIVYYKTVSDDSYAMFFKANKDEENDDVYITYLDVDGSWNKVKLAKKVNIGTTTQSSLCKTFDEKFNTLDAMDPQMVKIKLNSDGFVNQITTATSIEVGVGETSSDAIRKAKKNDGGFEKVAVSGTYIPGVKSLNHVIYLGNSARLFVVPESAGDKYCMDMYYVTDAASYFADTLFTVDAYDVDRYGYAEIFEIKGSKYSDRAVYRPFVVTSITDVVDQYGDSCKRVEGSGSGYKDISFYTAENSVVSGIKKGDVIRFILDNAGRIAFASSFGVNLQDDFQDGFTKENIDISGNANNTEYYTMHKMKATIEEIDFENGRIIFKYGAGENDEITFPFMSSIDCMEYNRTTRECDLINYDSFGKTDKVYVITEHHAISTMIRICD